MSSEFRAVFKLVDKRDRELQIFRVRKNLQEKINNLVNAKGNMEFMGTAEEIIHFLGKKGSNWINKKQTKKIKKIVKDFRIRDERITISFMSSEK